MKPRPQVKAAAATLAVPALLLAGSSASTPDRRAQDPREQGERFEDRAWVRNRTCPAEPRRTGRPSGGLRQLPSLCSVQGNYPGEPADRPAALLSSREVLGH